MPSVAADLTSRFRSEVERLTGNEGHIGLAVSGGADSLGLLLIAHATMPEWIKVATVDHGLRAEAAAEAAYVADICKGRGIHHSTLRPKTPISGSIQSAARAVRYALLEEWAQEQDLAWIATAHHIEDQAETLMMRLLRGSGIDGLSSIRSTTGKVIRPVLAWHRAELRALVDEAGITPVDDPSNNDSRFDRVRMRRLLAENGWLDATALAKSAAILADVNTALDWSARREAERRITRDGAGVALDPNHLPSELLRRLMITALRLIEPKITPRGVQLTNVIEALFRGEKVMIGNILCHGGLIWHLTSAPPRHTI
jgi:tRNA(Ile)-lysidine synthase